MRSTVIHDFGPTTTMQQHARNKVEMPLSRSFRCKVCGGNKNIGGRKKVRLPNSGRPCWACKECAGAK